MPQPCLHRRHLLAAAGAVGVGVPLLAACGPDEDKNAPPESGTEVTTTDKVPVGGGIVAGNVVVTQPTKGEFKAFSAVCTHAQCLVTEVSTAIRCPCHGSRFALTDGSVQQGPANDALAVVDIAVDGKTIRMA